MEAEYQKVWELLDARGFSLSEKLKIRNAFSKWGRQFDDNIEYNRKYEVYMSKKRSIGFRQVDEAKLFNTLVELAPDTETDKLVTVMKMLFKLLDVKSEYKF